MTELRSCPFCGGEVDLTNCTASTGKHVAKGTYVCKECDAKFTLKTTYHDFPMATLNNAWNTRVENEELRFTRAFIHDHGLEFALASAWERRKKDGK